VRREFVEEHRPLTEEERAPLAAKEAPALLPEPEAQDENGVPAPATSGLLGHARVIANRAFAETIPIQPNGHGNGNGHRDGHASGGQAAIGAEPAGPGRRDVER
jgi:hypothetical protein